MYLLALPQTNSCSSIGCGVCVGNLPTPYPEDDAPAIYVGRGVQPVYGFAVSYHFDWATIGSGISDASTLTDVGGLDMVTLLERDEETGDDLDWILGPAKLPDLAGATRPYVPGADSAPTRFAMRSGEAAQMLA